MYNDSGATVVENAAWPGVAMTQNSEGLYEYDVPEELENGNVLFTAGYSLSLIHISMCIRDSFYGYIHAKAIPGAEQALLTRLGMLVDRMSVNIELPRDRKSVV